MVTPLPLLCVGFFDTLILLKHKRFPFNAFQYYETKNYDRKPRYSLPPLSNPILPINFFHA